MLITEPLFSCCIVLNLQYENDFRLDLCVYFSVVSITTATRAALSSIELRRTYFSIENQVIAVVFVFRSGAR